MSRRKKTAAPSILRPARTQADYTLAQPVASYPVPPPYPFAAPAGPPESFEVRIQVLTDPHATVAKATFTEAGTWQPVYTATGSSRVDGTDVYDPETGTALAVSRALHALGLQLYRQANGRVQHAESNRKAAAAQRLRKEAEAAGVHPDDAEAFGEFRSVLTGVLAEHAGHGHDVVIHVPEGMTDADVPEDVRKMAESLFGDAVKFVDAGTATMPEEVREVVDELFGERKPGKHAKDENGNEPAGTEHTVLKQG